MSHRSSSAIAANYPDPHLIVQRDGIGDAVAAGRAVLVATSRFHHPAHAAEWDDPTIDATYNDMWQMLMDGLCVAKRPG
jgi:hypothetical protein